TRLVAFTPQRCLAAGRRWKDPTGFARSTALRRERRAPVVVATCTLGNTASEMQSARGLQAAEPWAGEGAWSFQTRTEARTALPRQRRAPIVNRSKRRLTCVNRRDSLDPGSLVSSQRTCPYGRRTRKKR